MKNLIMFIFLSSFISNHSYGVNAECSEPSVNELLCSYNGSTGLELFNGLEPIQIQRKYIAFKDTLGSIVLIQNARIQQIEYSECWSTSHNLSTTLLLYCNEEASQSSEIPSIILEEISHLKF